MKRWPTLWQRWGVVGFDTKQRELQGSPEDIGNMLLRYAGRIAAAANREAVAGNAAKMREALVKILQSFAADHYGENALSVGELFALAKSALSAPPRNCDAGTPKEQARRFELFCDGYKSGGEVCVGCPLDANWPELCAMRWVNMPYEATATQEGGAK